MTRLIICGMLMLATASVAPGNDTPPPAAAPVDFVRDIQPIFRARCWSCHAADKQRGGLRLDVKSAAFHGGETYSPAIVAGKSADSPLVRIVSGLEEGLVMPPEGARLTAEQVSLLRAWIDQGAAWPDSASATDDAASHWSFLPVRKPVVPAAGHWPRSPVDAFIAHQLESASSLTGSGDAATLSPSAEADRVTLIRRLSFDVLGLPPAPEDVAEFVADARPDALERLVDRLLASPHFGERWARHWLDVVRFAESDGFETNQPRPNAWPYRDYVIRALNDDIPYDQFLKEQLAGDVLGVDEATGFIVGGAWDRVKSPDPGLTAQQRADELHDMVSTTGSAFLGLTVGCARCHNHKFDPISQVDYYAMKAVFAGVQHGDRAIRPVDAPQRELRIAEIQRELTDVDAALRAFEPMAFLPPRGVVASAATVLLDDDTLPPTSPLQPSVELLTPRIGLEPHRPGTARGQASDPGDAQRLPNLGRNYSYWNQVAGKDVFAWAPRVSGEFHVWVSWGCGWRTHATDARYLLDIDGDPATTDDQRQIGCVDHQRFADGTGGDERQPLWSGFLSLGSHAFTPTTRLILRGGQTDAYVTADLICLQATTPAAVPAADPASLPHLRASVHRLSNVERFSPIQARFVRFQVDTTNNGAQPCIDELEVLSTAPGARNVARDARVTSSSDLPGHEIHQLRHVNDGRYGNAASWISNEAGRGWVLLEFQEPIEIDRVIWSRDRTPEGPFTDRIPTRYHVEAGMSLESMAVVATSSDRLPAERGLMSLPVRIGLSDGEQQKADQLVGRRQFLARELQQLTELRQVYAGRFVAPEPTFRFHRGDPLQPKEPVVPASLEAFGPGFKLAPDSAEPERRQQLARWMADPSHPLTARVLVNRLWHFHFGQGLVTTPSDFGRNGGRPSHPQLLDWLAVEATRPASVDGVPPTSRFSSLKRLHRLLVSSATYRQTGTSRPEGLQADAGARWLWRFPPRRLEAESLRDSILSVCGNLDDRMGGPGFDLFEPNTNYVKVYNSRRSFGPAEWRRMVYQSKPRMQLDDTFGQFDCPDAGQITPRRTSSITALQALNLLNSSFIMQQAGRFAVRLEQESGPDHAAQVRRAFTLAFQREPADDELQASVSLVGEHGLPAFCRALLNANEFLFVY